VHAGLLNRAMPPSSHPASKSHVPQNSFVFEKVVPALLIGLGILMTVLILFALAVLLGLIRF
jgi:hypothetical protein